MGEVRRTSEYRDGLLKKAVNSMLLDITLQIEDVANDFDVPLQRLKDVYMGYTLGVVYGKPILPSFISVVDNGQIRNEFNRENQTLGQDKHETSSETLIPEVITHEVDVFGGVEEEE